MRLADLMREASTLLALGAAFFATFALGARVTMMVLERCCR